MKELIKKYEGVIKVLEDCRTKHAKLLSVSDLEFVDGEIRKYKDVIEKLTTPLNTTTDTLTSRQLAQIMELYTNNIRIELIADLFGLTIIEVKIILFAEQEGLKESSALSEIPVECWPGKYCLENLT